MTCPFLEEIAMVYCRAYPVRKLVPKHGVTTECSCMSEGYRGCFFFKEIMARLESSADEEPELSREESWPGRKEAVS